MADPKIIRGDEIVFADRSFCFTGTMASMKRSLAQREARARGGLTMDVVNERLDYLVIGSISSPGWKFGDYGRKIESARVLRRSGGTPRLIPETTFVDALGFWAPNNSGEIDEKVFVGTYKFLTQSLTAFDLPAFEVQLEHLQERGFHVRVDATDALVGVDLFEWDADSGAHEIAAGDTYLVVEARMMCHLMQDTTGQQRADEIERMFEQVAGVDGTLRWFERSEGTAGFVRLMRELDQRTLGR